MNPIPFVVLMDVILNIRNILSTPDYVICLLSALIANDCAGTTRNNNDARVCGYRRAACVMHVLSATKLTEHQIGLWFDAQLRYFREFRKTGKDPKLTNIMTVPWLTKQLAALPPWNTGNNQPKP